MEIPTNPDVLRFGFSLALSLLSLMVGIVSFLLIDKFHITGKTIKKREEEQQRYMEKLGRMLDSIKETIINLSVIVEVIRTQQEERDPRMDRKLDRHSQQIRDLDVKMDMKFDKNSHQMKEIDVRVTKVEEFCRYKHK